MESTLIENHMNALYARNTGAGSRLPRVHPRERPIIIACMSPGVDPAGIFGLMEGEAYCIRTAGNIITQDTIRCILLAMMTDRISDVIVLGHTNCSNADKEKVYKTLDKFTTRLPQRSYFRDVLGTREKALKYLGIFIDEIENIYSQLQNLTFLKTIQPGVNITGMLYSEKSGQIFTLAELDKLRKQLAQDPDIDVDELVPGRYAAYAKARRSRDGQGLPFPSSASAETASNAPAEVDDQVVSTLPSLASAQPANTLQSEFSGQQLAFEKLMEAMQKSITKVSKVRIFVPRIRVPRVKGSDLASEPKSPAP